MFYFCFREIQNGNSGPEWIKKHFYKRFENNDLQFKLMNFITNIIETVIVYDD